LINNPKIDFKIILRQDENVQKRFDKRKYNLPNVKEVAAIVVGNDDDLLNTNRQIRIYKKHPSGDTRPKIIRDDHTAYDPLHYVLMHMFGESGWSYKLIKKKLREKDIPTQLNNNNNINNGNDLFLSTNSQFLSANPNLNNSVSSNSSQESIQSNHFEDENDFNDNILNCTASSYSTKYVTCCEYYSARLMRTDDSHFHYFGRLYQQYIVDQYLKIEASKLRYIKHNQAKLRVELYKGLVDAFNKSDANLEETGQRLILPSSFNGGPRYMLNLFHDAMAIVKEFGKPDLFVTITCNPHWIEILNELGPHQTAQDIPDIVSRVFKIKLNALMNLIMKKHVFGKVNAHMYVIEFQKRGLPHAHILLILEQQDKIKTIDDINKIVSAEIPDPITQPQLYKTVTTCMNHGHCGLINPQASCMKDGKCTKHYPKEFIDETQNHNDGYPLYRRRNNGITFVDGKGHVCDNRHIVPYNPQLSTIFDCHINVEICTSIKAVKYIYKYIYKGKLFKLNINKLF
jgi:hypothetical protein